MGEKGLIIKVTAVISYRSSGYQLDRSFQVEMVKDQGHDGEPKSTDKLLSNWTVAGHKGT